MIPTVETERLILRPIAFQDMEGIYRLLKAYWGKGYATEATKASLAFAFSKLGAETVYGHTHHENLASRNVLEKAGLIYKETFQFEGIPHLWFEINKP